MHRTALILIFGCIPLLAQQPDPDPRVRWLAEHAVLIRTADPGDADFQDLERLRPQLEGARVVMLGEQSHGDGAAFLLKTRLIRYLHEKLGFDVLAFESGLYDCRKAWEALRDRGDAHPALAQGIFGIWMQSAQVEPLVGYLAARSKSERPLELCGFDCQLTGSASREQLARDLRAFATGEPRACDETTLQTLDRLAEVLQEEKPPAAALRAQQRALAALAAGLARPDVKATRKPTELAWWRQLVQSLQALAEYRGRKPAGAGRLAEDFNPRDAQMGKNLVWLAQERHAGRKLIVWAATMHIARNHDVIATGKPELDYRGVQAMGHHVHKALGREAFAVGFVAHSGRAGLPWAEPWELKAAPRDSLEDLCLRAGLDQAWVPLREPPEFLRARISSRPLGHSDMRADWSQVLDAVVFQRVMTPSTRRADAEQRAVAADLVAALEQTWQTARQRLAAQNPWADKVSFTPDWENWRQVAEPKPEQLAAKANELRAWSKRYRDEAGFLWRWLELEARIAADQGDRRQALALLEQALAAYPPAAYADPTRHSRFQHLANDLGLLVWDDDGFEAAVRAFADLLAKDERCHYFHDEPWERRLAREPKAAEKRKALRDAIRAAYERRAERFPAHAERARAYARALR